MLLSGAELNKVLTYKITECCGSSLVKSKSCPPLIHRCLLLMSNYSSQKENGFPAVFQLSAALTPTLLHCKTKYCLTLN